MQVHDWTAPALHTALDVSRVVTALRARWGAIAGAPAIERAQVVDVRYRPDRPCWLLYRLKLRSGTKSARWQLFAGRLIQPDEPPPSPPPAALTQAATRVRSPLPASFAVLEECGVALYAFPVDEALPGLGEALNDAAVVEQFARHWADGQATVRRVRARALGYTPWARAAIEDQVLAERGRLPELRRFIGKLHAAKPAARRFADAWTVWRAARGHIGLAPPAGFLGPLNVTLQEQVRGVRLGALVGSRQFTARVRQAAPMLAALHDLAIPLSATRTSADEAATVHRWASLLLVIRPDLSGRITALRDRIAARLDAFARPIGPVHADFHHTNLLVDDDALTIIDFDEMAIGDPLLDVGRFLASLRIPALRACGSPDALRPAGIAFLEAYRARAPHDMARVRLFEAAALMTAAASAFRIQRPQWKREVELLIGEAEQAADAACLGAAQIAAGVPARRAIAARTWLTDPMFLRAALEPGVRETFGADLTGCRIAASRHAATAPLTVDLRGWQGREPWMQRVEIIAPVPASKSVRRRLDALRRALADVPDAPRLPRPIAALPALDALVVRMPRGRTIAQLLAADSDEAAVAITAAARALAAVHAVVLPAPLSHARTAPISTPGARLEGARAFLAGGDGHDAIERVEAAIGQAPRVERFVLRRCTPRHLAWSRDRIAALRVDGIGTGHPLDDAAEFLARLAIDADGSSGPDRQALAEDFRRDYCERVGAEWTRWLPVFEAAALLRTLARRGPSLAATARARIAAEVMRGVEASREARVS